ncbi:hypothetical protein [Pseudomonas savastanoi]|uniref:hypothetical protein n=1 Tax=Pseudomonas savastanoi TaxID=29438 RepID=UPI000EFDC559|nr:hypothetical protein [Pseudomonas savastanoi]
MHNFHFWVQRFRDDFIPTIQRVEDVFLLRLQPTFTSIEAESEKLEDDLWESAMSQPYYGDYPDEGDIAEAVRDASVSHYMGLKGMEQGLLNCCALFLYHLYEQQVMIFLRQELLPWRKKDDKTLYTHGEVRKRLGLINVDITKFACWAKLEELRHLANAIKHGEGKSSVELLKIAPHLFEVSGQVSGWPLSGRVYTPLLGEDIFVNAGHIHEYVGALKQYWMELGDALTKEA